MQISFRTLVFVAVATSSALAYAEPTRELRLSGTKEIFPGDPQTSSVDASGRISMGLSIAERAKTGHPVIVMHAVGKNFYLGTAGGGLVQVRPNGTTKQLLPRPKAIVTALADAGGVLYAATAPSGEIYAITLSSGAVKAFFKPKQKYVWSIVAERKDQLLIATGEPAILARVRRGGRSTTLFESKEKHLRAIATHRRRGILVGGGDKGIVYEVDGKKVRALYDSPMQETTDFAIDPKSGDVFVSFVSEAKEGALLPEKMIGKVGSAKKTKKDKDSPIKGSEVVRLSPDGEVDVLYSSRDEGAMSLAWSRGRLYLSTATRPKDKARVYAIDPANRDRLILAARLEAPMATAIVEQSGSLMVGTAPVGRLMQLGPGDNSKAIYVSDEQDLQRVSRIGRIWFDADVPRGSQVAVSLRSGNTKEADETWSGWSAAATQLDGGDVKVPRARYVQFKVELSKGAKAKAPLVKSLHASVMRINEAPEVSEVFTLRRGVYMAAIPNESEKEKTMTLSSSTLKDLRGPAKDRSKRIRVRQGSRAGMMTVAWKAKDTNGDKLLYKVEMRSLDRREAYRQVANDLRVNFHTFDSRALPDGRYQVRVTASDRPSNPPSEMRTDANASEPFTIDNEPPVISKVRATSPGRGKVRIEASVADRVSTIGNAEFSLSGGPWLMLPAADGLIDAKSERLVADVESGDAPGATKLESGRQTVLIRVEDDSGNSATTSTLLDVR